MSEAIITFTGNLTEAPELRFTKNGKPVASLSVAVNSYSGKDSQQEQTVSFYNVTVWDRQAENVAASVTKGNMITVSGRMNQETYQNNQGENRRVYRVTASTISVPLFNVTVQITKNPRNDMNDMNSDPWSAPPAMIPQPRAGGFGQQPNQPAGFNQQPNNQANTPQWQQEELPPF